MEFGFAILAMVFCGMDTQIRSLSRLKIWVRFNVDRIEIMYVI